MDIEYSEIYPVANRIYNSLNTLCKNLQNREQAKLTFCGSKRLILFWCCFSVKRKYVVLSRKLLLPYLHLVIWEKTCFFKHGFCIFNFLYISSAAAYDNYFHFAQRLFQYTQGSPLTSYCFNNFKQKVCSAQPIYCFKL